MERPEFRHLLECVHHCKAPLHIPGHKAISERVKAMGKEVKAVIRIAGFEARKSPTKSNKVRGFARAPEGSEARPLGVEVERKPRWARGTDPE